MLETAIIKSTLTSINKSKRFMLFYNTTIIGLSLLAIGLLIAEYFKPEYENVFRIIDNGIIAIFALDYLVRLVMAESKLNFIRANVIDLIAIIPFNSIFQTLRIARLLRFIKMFKALRILAFMGKFQKSIEKFVKTNNFHYVLLITTVTIFAGALGMQLTEDKTFADSLWWSFVTATTVGYGDISPATTQGRIIAAILMVSGIGFIGMLTGTISTFFLSKHNEIVTFKNETLENIKGKLDNFDNLSKEDIDDICLVLKSLKKSTK